MSVSYDAALEALEQADKAAQELVVEYGELKAERDRLREALEWYADADYYTPCGWNMIIDDSGDRAKKALAGGQGERETRCQTCRYWFLEHAGATETGECVNEHCTYYEMYTGRNHTCSEWKARQRERDQETCPHCGRVHDPAGPCIWGSEQETCLQGDKDA